MRNRRLMPLLVRAALMMTGATGPAMAHHLPPGMEEVDEFAAEPLAAALMHPLSGADHWLAALAVGLIAWSWGRKTGFHAGVHFVLGIVVGIVAGRAGVRLPFMEAGLAVSVILAGGVAAGPRWISCHAVPRLAAAVGLWQGIVHGMEMPLAAPAGVMALGLALSSGAIALVAGLFTLRLPMEHPTPRWAGGGIAMAGACLLFSSLAS